MTQEPRIVLVCPFFVKPREINKQRYYKPFYNNINKLPDNSASHLKSPFVVSLSNHETHPSTSSGRTGVRSEDTNRQLIHSDG